MFSQRKIGVLFSGGLDSAALIGYFLGRGWDVWPIYTRANLPWESAERNVARKFLETFSSRRLQELTSVNLDLENAYESNWSWTGQIPGANSPDEEVYLPARNLLLITKAFLFLSSKKISRLALATLKGNPFPDASRSYFQSLERVLSKSFNSDLRILAPFRSLSKTDVIKKFHRLPLHLTFSCIAPLGNQHCGQCNKCAERRRAFKKARVVDKTLYARG